MRPYYEADGVTIYHGDCREIEHPAPDAVITDPPYGIAISSHGQRFARATTIAGDETVEVGAEQVARWLDTGVCIAAFASPALPWPGKWRNMLAWDKGAHVGIGGDRATCWKRTWELLQVANNPRLNGQRDSGVLRFNAVSPPPSGHVAEKPLALMAYLIEKLTQPGNLVLDPFMGSGTTLRAAKDAGRRAIGIDVEERWCEYAARRLEQGALSLSAAVA